MTDNREETSGPPALSEEELRETLDLLSTVLASVSDRVDAQTQALDRLTKNAAETRQAAFSAKAQTDPERYGEMVGRAVAAHMGQTLNRLDGMSIDLSRGTARAEKALAKAEEDQRAVYRALRERERKVERFKARLPWLGLGAIGLALAMTLLLTRFLADYGATCTVMGAAWTQTTEGRQACVFYGK